MGCEKSRCKLCTLEITGSNGMRLIMFEHNHIEKKHPKVFEKNKKAEFIYQQELKEALEKKLKNSVSPLFTHSKWDGEDYEEENK